MSVRTVEVSVGENKYRVRVCENTPGEAVYEAGIGKIAGTHIASAPEVMLLADKGIFRSAALTEEFYANLRGDRKAYVTHGFPLLRRGRSANLQSSAPELAGMCIEDGVPILTPAQYRQLPWVQFSSGKEVAPFMVEFDLEEVRRAPQFSWADSVIDNSYAQARLGLFDMADRHVHELHGSRRQMQTLMSIPLQNAAFEGLTEGMVYVNSLTLDPTKLLESTSDAKITVLALDDYAAKSDKKDGVFSRVITRTFSDLRRAWSSSIDVISRAWSSAWSDAVQALPPGDHYPRAQPAEPQSALEQKVRVDAFLDTFVDSLGKAKCILCAEPLASHPNECLFLESRQSLFVHGGCYDESPKEGARALRGDVLSVTYLQLSAAAKVLQQSPVRELAPNEFFEQLKDLEGLLSKHGLKKAYEKALGK